MTTVLLRNEKQLKARLQEQQSTLQSLNRQIESLVAAETAASRATAVSPAKSPDVAKLVGQFFAQQRQITLARRVGSHHRIVWHKPPSPPPQHFGAEQWHQHCHQSGQHRAGRIRRQGVQHHLQPQLSMGHHRQTRRFLHRLCPSERSGCGQRRSGKNQTGPGQDQSERRRANGSPL